MDIKKSLLNFVTDGVVTCKQLDDFYDAYHEDKEFQGSIDLLSSIAIDMRQLKEELQQTENSSGSRKFCM